MKAFLTEAELKAIRQIEAVLKTVWDNIELAESFISKAEEAASGKGDILELLFLLDSFEARNQDTEGFERATKEYAGHARVIAWLRGGGLTSPENVQFRSQQAATLISATVSAIVIVAMSLIYVI